MGWGVEKKPKAVLTFLAYPADLRLGSGSTEGCTPARPAAQTSSWLD